MAAKFLFVIVIIYHFNSLLCIPLDSVPKTSVFPRLGLESFLINEKRQECKDTRDDCDWIKRNNKGKVKEYCNAHRDDESVKQCAETCSLCKAPAPPKPQECKDEREDCNWIGQNYDDVEKYCKNHKNDEYIKKCTKTCGFCPSEEKAPAPPVPEPLDCEDTRNDCAWINEHVNDVEAYCNMYKDVPAIKECSKTCRFCKVKAPAPAICEDTRVGGCSWIEKLKPAVRELYCKVWRDDLAVNECAKTCGFC